MRNEQERGFTLIELLVVVLVLLTLVLIAGPPLRNAQLRAEIAQVQKDLKVVESAMEWYYLDHKKYPDGPENGSLSNRSSSRKAGLGLLTEPVQYLEEIPADRFHDRDDIEVGRKTYKLGSGGLKEGPYIPAWILVSSGPDRFTDTSRIGTFPMGTTAYNYDPTNGLRSEGDILRFGGDWSEGDWFLNGHRICQRSGE